MKKVPLAFFLFFLPLALFSQETAVEPQPELPADRVVTGDANESLRGSPPVQNVEMEPAKKNKGLDPASVLDRDIETATAEELSDWCRSLGISGDGGKETLADRLREYYKLEKPVVISVEKEEKKEPLIITIESAKTTEYFTVESVNEEYVRLKGGVSITVRDGNTVHQIKADEILYNRTRELMTASGGVVYVKKDANLSDGEETTFKGQGITVNLNNWSTAFMEGVSDRSVGGGTKYRFSGEVISRSGDDSTVLRHAKITNAEREEPYWSIDASRLWLLPGSDFAILNAVIKVGEIPILWFPAFFYPGSDVAFHPVLGIRSREGSFLQTTTYILGQKKDQEKDQLENSEEASSFTSIMGGGEGMEKRREGIFLRSTGRKAVNANETNLYLMADAYSKLGYFLGSELNIPSSGHVGALSFGIGLAYSRDIYDEGGYYTPHDNNGESNWHYSKIFDYDIPFPLRYRFISAGSVSGSNSVVKSMSFSWDIPFYSDPYIENDFIKKRSVNSDIFNLLKTANTVENPTTDTYINTNNWTLNGGLSLGTGILTPFVNELSVSNSMSINFDTRTTRPWPSGLSYPPNARFFYPNKFTLFNISASIGGTPITLGAETLETNSERRDAEISWGNPVSPWNRDDDKSGESNNIEDNAPDSGFAVTETSDDLLVFTFPTLSRTIPAMIFEGHLFTLNYRIIPTASSEIKFNSSNVNHNWNAQEDVDWSDWAHQFFYYIIEGNMGLNLSEKRNMYTNSLTFNVVKSAQEYIYLNEEASEYSTAAQQEDARRKARNQTYFRSVWGNTFIYNPFFQTNVWKNTNLQYSVTGLLYEQKYDTNTGSLINEWGEWTQEKITTNRFSANIRANVMDYMQSLTINADIPPEEYDKEKTTTPLKPAISGEIGIKAWISSTTVSTSVKDPFGIAFYDAVIFTESLKFGDATLTHNMVYVPENSKDNPLNTTNEKSGIRSMQTSLSWKNFDASFWAQRGKTLYLDTTPLQSGWKEKNDEEILNPQSLSFSYFVDKTYKQWTNVEGSVELRTSLNFNLQQYTNSSFNFFISTKFKINQFLDINLSSSSDNTQIYRYFRNMPFFEPINVDMPGEKNIFIDLLNSFRFDDIEKRRASGFKLRSFNLNLTHYLGDWKAKLDITLYPELNTLKRIYEFKNKVSFIVAWAPIQEFKTDIDISTDEGLKYNTK